MDRAAGPIAFELRKVQRLGHHALAREGRVAMDQQRDHARALRVAEPVLLGPHHAFHHRIHSFQMARIRGERNRDFPARWRLMRIRWRRGDTSRRPSPACDGRIDIAFKLGEDLAQRLADDVGQDVQPAAVRHADHDFVHVRVRPRGWQSRQESGSWSPRLRAKTASAR